MDKETVRVLSGDNWSIVKTTNGKWSAEVWKPDRKILLIENSFVDVVDRLLKLLLGG